MFKDKNPRKLFYLTFGDSPGGVLYSQAIDVCNFLNSQPGTHINMVFFISIRGFFGNRKQFKKLAPKCTVLPMLPTLSTWRWNAILLAVICLLNNYKSIMARGVLAANIALTLKRYGFVQKVCYDGRGAYNAEWQEYNISPNVKLKQQIARLESIAINKSDFRLAVSHSLVLLWKQQFGYNQNLHVVIPCLLNSAESYAMPLSSDLQNIRMALGYKMEDVVFIYSGSTAGWQSFQLLENCFGPLLSSHQNFKMLFLANETQNLINLKNKYPDQIQYKWVSTDEVHATLLAGDYGILMREQSVTNSVASPTKFAQYLAAGLNVIVSEGLGDCTQFVQTHRCGFVAANHLNQIPFVPVDLLQRVANIALAECFFTKKAHRADYQKILQALA